MPQLQTLFLLVRFGNNMLGNVFKSEQAEGCLFCTIFGMSREIEILSVVRDGEDGILVTFSDRTIGGYISEELLELRPVREQNISLAETEGQVSTWFGVRYSVRPISEHMQSPMRVRACQKMP